MTQENLQESKKPTEKQLELHTSFIRFLRIYNLQFNKNIKLYSSFLNFFHKYHEDAIEYLSTLEDPHSESFIEAKKKIWQLNNQYAWTKDISRFKIKVDWEKPEDKDLFLLPYSTLYKLLTAISAAFIIKKLPFHSPSRELFALLLQNLLPIYFLKAANITEVVKRMQLLFKDVFFVCVGCEPSDYPPMDKPEDKPDPWKYDACRGFEQKYNQQGNFYYLLLRYNPESENISDRHKKLVEQAEEEFIKKALNKLNLGNKESQESKKSQESQESQESSDGTKYSATKPIISYSLSFTETPTFLNGEKVIFDKAVATTPVALEPKPTHRQAYTNGNGYRPY